ncbi:hypothetical protein GLA29479_5114 [Lysobacter antibioticus]|nr:hypothetical protein GLA29479_5077 [Lysobacter antibioticus]ALN65939.1 hypothetical protein GLA29479_5114 [Lysobacter antibioticus]
MQSYSEPSGRLGGLGFLEHAYPLTTTQAFSDGWCIQLVTQFVLPKARELRILKFHSSEY